MMRALPPAVTVTAGVQPHVALALVRDARGLGPALASLSAGRGASLSAGRRQRHWQRQRPHSHMQPAEAASVAPVLAAPRDYSPNSIFSDLLVF
jgi:hypothetical protein